MTLILTYALVDDPHQEHEEEVASVAAARQYLTQYAGLLEWAELTNGHGDLIDLGGVP